MIAPKTDTPPNPKVVAPKKITGTVPMTPDTASSQNRIRQRAYELYESRGGEPGQGEQDWLRAEHEILGGKG